MLRLRGIWRVLKQLGSQFWRRRPRIIQKCGQRLRKAAFALDNTGMLEMIILALLVWLLVIERRLNGLLQSVDSLKLDVDGLRIEIANTRTEPKHGHAAPSPVQKVEGAATPLPNGMSPWWKPA